MPARHPYELPTENDSGDDFQGYPDHTYPANMNHGSSSNLRSGSDSPYEKAGPGPGLPGGGAPRGGGGAGRGKKPWIIGGIALIVIAAIAIPVGVVYGNKNSKDSSDGDNPKPAPTSCDSDDCNPAVLSGAWVGLNNAAHVMVVQAPAGAEGDTSYAGSNGQLEETHYTYNNSFGGRWSMIPYDGSAQAQSDSPPLSEKWDWSKNRIRGVNLGGWLVLEPLVTPDLFAPYENNTGTDPGPALDEWRLCQNLGDKAAETIEGHYKTFITERDFAEIAAAGLNWVRLPVGWWIIETWDGEPYVANVGWKYLENAVNWARKYGIRINLDYHASPGSQNGQPHSGKSGTINFLLGTMGIANAQRALNYIRVLADFSTQDSVKDVVQLLTIMNEPLGENMGFNQIGSFHYQAYKAIRDITGFGEGNGPMAVMSDAFFKEANWSDVGYLNGADRLAMDTHSYIAYTTDTIHQNLSFSGSSIIPCQWWGSQWNTTANKWGYVFGGEWSAAVNDCGQYVNGVNLGTRYEGSLNTSDEAPKPIGNCLYWDNWPEWNDDVKQGIKLVVSNFMDSIPNQFFWTWKTGNNTRLGLTANPFWSYSLLRSLGAIPEDQRTTYGSCAAKMPDAGGKWTPVDFDGNYPSYATGGSGAGTLGAGQESSWGVWPPTALLGIPSATNLPTYAPTGSPLTFAVPTPMTPLPANFSGSNFAATPTAPAPSGWSTGWYTSNPSCDYQDPWSGNGAPVPTQPACH